MSTSPRSPQTAGETSAALAADCPPELTDGWLVHAAALQAGCGTLLFPGQALLLTHEDGTLDGGSFAHGVPQQTQLSTATLVQDRRVRRAMLEQHRIRVPEGATFTIGGGTRAALAFAERRGFPVVLKPMVGDNTIETRTGITSTEDLLEGIRDLRVAPQLRPDYTTASYAFTAIHTPREDDQTRTRKNYRYLIEEQVRGEFVRFLLIAGEVVSAFHSPAGAWGTGGGGAEVRSTIHPSLVTHSEEVASVFPGLAVIAVDVVLSRGAKSPLETQDVVVVDVSERPWLSMQSAEDPAWSLELARRILARTVAEGAGEAFGEPQATVALDVRWEGVSVMEDFLEHLARAAAGSGLRGYARAEDVVGGIARGHLEGSAAAVALFNELAVAGTLAGEHLMCVDSRPASATGVSGFSTGADG
ncbi:hypothetical protein [Nesterenkonia xinjiangensis]|uniref:ATP-grasp domain-containing protein n=1 Tax=Nesterenkonia xinjiangensis TaxID=225327 RepID=A0A7Z0K7V2_9MICC|nr:hypothetical protein [Nesterenkonia xinjiangensis]NYJ76986.1 hypothetical protein [Nesterenkonia xinjiangensis]